jgi:hypothetical protein
MVAGSFDDDAVFWPSAPRLLAPRSLGCCFGHYNLEKLIKSCFPLVRPVCRPPARPPGIVHSSFAGSLSRTDWRRTAAAAAGRGGGGGGGAEADSGDGGGYCGLLLLPLVSDICIAGPNTKTQRSRRRTG